MVSLHYEINLPQIPEQPRKLTVLTMPENALCLCAANYTNFMTSQNLDYRTFKMR